MSDKELRDALRSLAEPVGSPPGGREEILARVARVRRWRFAGSGLAVAASVAAIAMTASLLTGNDTSDGNSADVATGTWSEIAPSPLSPRSGEVAVWTGTEMIVAGGTDMPLCPPGADCAGPTDAQRLADGGAYDPATDTWRRIADAPQSLTYAQAIWTGTEMLVLAPRLDPQAEGDNGQDAATLLYDPARDSWRTLDPAPVTPNQLGWTGRYAVVPQGSEEGRDVGDWLLDPAKGRWQRLPDDPFPATFDRALTWTGDALVLTGLLIDEPDADNKTFVVATLDLDSMQWEREPRSPVRFWTQAWYWFDERVITAIQRNSMPDDSTVGASGALDPLSGEWEPVPQSPLSVDEAKKGCPLPAIGPAGDWLAEGGPILVSLEAATTLRTPPCPQLTEPHVGVWTGDALLVWGGSDRGYKANLAVGLMWQPPSPG